MRSRSVVISFVTLTAGLAASAVVRRLAGRRPRPAQVTPSMAVPPAAAAPRAAAPAAAVAAPAVDAVVLPFSRRTAVAPAQQRPAAPTRCGDSGGRTKAGAPCAARGTVGGRCHHHRRAA